MELSNRTLANGTLTNATDGAQLVLALPRLLSSLSKAAEQKAREIHNDEPDSNTVPLGFLYGPYTGACMLMAFVLNTTVVFASARRQVDRMTRSSKLILRAISLYAIINALWDVVIQFGYINPTARALFGDVLPETPQPLESLLWEVFVTLCVSQLLETFVSITSGQEPSNDTGLTLFEHSLAFPGSQYMEKPSPQLLIICIFSLVGQAVTHVLGITNLKRYQLIPSTIIGLGFIAFYIYSVLTDTIVEFPLVVIVSFIPQILVLAISILCLCIYGLAVLATRDPSALAYTPMIMNLRESLNLQWNNDFNSFVMRFGFIMSNAVENEEHVNEMSELRFSKGTYQDQHHLLSGYLNKVDNNPELLEQSKKKSADDGASHSWLFFRKIMNIVRLVQSIFKILMHLRNDYLRTSNATQRDTQPLTSKASTRSSLLDTGDLIDGSDDSADYYPDSDSDLEPLEYDSEIEDEQPETEYVSTLAMARMRDVTGTSTSFSTSTPSSVHPTTRSRPIDELFTSHDVLQLITPTDLDEASYISRIRAHILKDQRLTRSQYCSIHEDDLLREVILQNRPQFSGKQEHHDDDDMNCVVCQTERRSIVLWPCKCFALCEGCRCSLGVRGFVICVCCRAKVDGYSKVFMP